MNRSAVYYYAYGRCGVKYVRHHSLEGMHEQFVSSNENSIDCETIAKNKKRELRFNY